MRCKLSFVKREALEELARTAYPKIPSEFYCYVMDEHELNTVNNLIAVMPFYTISTSSEGYRADHLQKQFKGHLDGLRDLLEKGVTLGEYNRLTHQLNQIEIPSFSYASEASSKINYMKHCKTKLASFGKRRQKAILYLLSPIFDVRNK